MGTTASTSKSKQTGTTASTADDHSGAASGGIVTVSAASDIPTATSSGYLSALPRMQPSLLSAQASEDGPMFKHAYIVDTLAYFEQLRVEAAELVIGRQLDLGERIVKISQRTRQLGSVC
jgi:hypothetical protein